MPKKSPKIEKPVATKAAKIAALLQRNTGATLADLVKVTSWQEHSIRGFMSGTLKKKQGIEVRSTSEEGKPRRYFIDRAAS
jgi:hypothetical protein